MAQIQSPSPTKAELHRLKLQDLLEDLGDLLPSELTLPNQTLFPGGKLRAYLQPGPTVTMQYPCAVYKFDGWAVRYANNRKYFRKKRWTVTVMDRNPDSDIPDLVESLPQCEFDRFFIRDGLNQWVYTLFF